jgi:D-alanine--poly(phosphoribitol) ligase subunit 1
MNRSDVLSNLIRYRETRPDQPAVKDLDRALSYAELIDEIDRWASGLIRRGVKGGDRVALHLPNSVDFVVAALACLRVGAIFVPLAVTDPATRLDAILEDCTPVLVVSSGEPTNGSATTRRLNQSSWVECSELYNCDDEVLPPVAISPPNRLAYAIYTSGTTGSPKGVMINHRAFGAAVRSTANALGLDHETRTLCVSPFYFDGSFGTLFPTLFVGGAVVIRPRESLLFPRTFFNAVLREDITYTGFSPSYLKLLLSNPQMAKLKDSTLNIVALGGEASSVADIRALWQAAPAVRIFNRYGPTETTIAVTHIELTPELVADGTVPLGIPHPEVTFHIADDDGVLVADDGVVGELYIGGAQLMSGYWGATALTDEVMRTDIVSGETVYRTGDLVYRNEHGHYVFVDRTDRVVKRSGVRISLLELADALQSLPGVTSATCVVYDRAGAVGIVAFVVADGTQSPHDLRSGARDRLPDTMLPDRIDLVDELPLTAAGKLDERRLLAGAGLIGPATSRQRISATVSA